MCVYMCVCMCVSAALVEGRGLAKGEVGLAAIDLKNPVLSLSQVWNCVHVCVCVCAEQGMLCRWM